MKAKINLGHGLEEVTIGPDVDLDVEEFDYDGERLTEARAEDLGLNRGGRPALDPAGGPSVRVAVRLPEVTAARLDAVASAAGKRRSEVLRDALDSYLAG